MSDIPHGGAPRKRSPSYPSIDLDEAIRRARQLWEKQHDYPTPLLTAFNIWGYESTAGNANLVVAALRKFGLVEYEGSGKSRKVKVTPLAIEILSHPDPTRRTEAIKVAALLPDIHQELWQRFGAKLPTDDHLRWELEQERGFSRSGAADFIPEYRRTLTFAGLGGGDTVAPQEPQGPIEDGADDEEPLPPFPRRPRRRVSDEPANVLTIPLAGRGPVLVEGEFPITEQDWTQFMAVLNAMKPGLVREPEREPDED